MYNTSTNTFVPLHIAENPFCGAQALLPDGQGVVVGGMNMFLVCVCTFCSGVSKLHSIGA